MNKNKYYFEKFCIYFWFIIFPMIIIAIMYMVKTIDIITIIVFLSLFFHLVVLAIKSIDEVKKSKQKLLDRKYIYNNSKLYN